MAAAEDAAPAPAKLKVRPPDPINPEPPGAAAGSPIPLPAGTKKRSSKKRLILIAAGAVVLLGGGFFAYTTFFTEEPPPPPVVKKAPAPAPKADAPKTAAAPEAGKAPANGVTPAPAVSTAGKAVEKAQAAVAGRTNDGKAAAPETIEDRAPAAPNLAVAPQQGPAAPAAAEVKVAANITGSTKGVDSTPDASPAFRAWVVNARISGVRAGGASPTAFINGRLINRGGNVDDALGIVLDNIDADKRQLIFRDKTGATVARPYF